MRTRSTLTVALGAALSLACQQRPATTADQPAAPASNEPAASTMPASGTTSATPAAGAAAQADPDRAITGSALPAGWSVRADRNAATTNVKVEAAGSGLHVTLGPAVVLYRTADIVTGKFHTLATFTRTKAPQHPEGYGLFVGGKNLDGEAQQYVYFLVRGDGSYLIKRRNGAATENITSGWVAHQAPAKADAGGKAVDRLEIDGKAAANEVSFSINGQKVHTMKPGDIDIDGVVGLRLNHNLDVNVEGFDIHRL